MIKQREKKIANNSKSNPKAFWNYVNRKTKTKVSVTDLYKDENTIDITRNDSEKAGLLADFFTSVLTLDQDITQPDISAPQDVPCLDFLTITPQIVEKRLKN